MSIRRKPQVEPLDGELLGWLLDEFLGQRTGDPSTTAGYGYKLRHFRTWWAETGPGQGWRLLPSDLQRFESWLQDQGLAYHTRHDALRRLRQALLWAFRAGYTDRNYAAWVPTAQGGPQSRQVAPLAALRALMQAAGWSSHPARDQAMLATLLGMGLRRAECASLDVEQVVIEADGSGFALVHGKRTRANQSGERAAAFDAATGRYLRIYVDMVPWRSGPMWRNGQGGRLQPISIYRVVKRCIRAAQLEDSIQGCHDLRRAFATYYARHRRDETSADLLRRQLGHADYRMTSHYSLLDVEDIRADLVSPFALLASDDTACAGQ